MKIGFILLSPPVAAVGWKEGNKYMYEDIKIEDALELNNARFVDLRSPAEYELDTIPGSVNIPLFNNEERKLVGIVYTEQGPKQARNTGLELVTPKLPVLVKKIEEIKNGYDLVIFCWRGGLRSRAIAEVLDLMGISCYRIDGGYKAYRSYVNIYYKKSELPQTFIVLYGLTGTGKTQIIQKLTERNWPAIDLEGLANHRGSVFGSIGLGSQPAQKWFESQLLANLKQFEQSKVLIVEGESRRIGKIFIPETVYQGMQNGKRILIYDEMGNRVRRLMDDYTAGADNNLEEIANSLNFLQRRLGKNKVKSLQILLQNNDLEKVATSLLDDYYDVLYHHPDHPDSDYDLSVDSSDLDLAIKRIEEYVHHLILNWGD